jgi:8-oxo-dGTP pyrophosphatase MutT (NUDIX family)
MTDAREQRPEFVRKPGDGWIECGCGSQHWGLNGAAGLFLVRRTHAATGLEVLMQHRAPWSHQGGTWAVPGGAIMDGESATAAALRETWEEAGVPPEAAAPFDELITSNIRVGATDSESLSIEWVDLDDLLDPTEPRPLLPAFKAALPTLVTATTRHFRI